MLNIRSIFKSVKRLSERPSRPVRFFATWPAVIAALSLALLFSYRALGIIEKERGVAKEKARIEADIQKITEENKRLDKEIANANSPEAIEKIAKGQLNLQNPGELVAVIVNRDTPAAATSSAPASFFFRIRDAIRRLLGI